jgi:hypothetical protein
VAAPTFSDPPLCNALSRRTPGSRVQVLRGIRLLSLIYGTPEAIPIRGKQQDLRVPAAAHNACHSMLTCWCGVDTTRYRCCPLLYLDVYVDGPKRRMWKVGCGKCQRLVLEGHQLEAVLRSLEVPDKSGDVESVPPLDHAVEDESDDEDVGEYDVGNEDEAVPDMEVLQYASERTYLELLGLVRTAVENKERVVVQKWLSDPCAPKRRPPYGSWYYVV